MTDYPYEEMDKQANLWLDRAITAPRMVAADADPATKLKVALTLIAVLEGGLKIAHDFIVTGNEPYPGAALAVVSTAQRSVELARKAGLVPERPERR